MSTMYLVTGANRGIGLEIAKRVLANGDRLVAVCRHPETADALNALVAGHAGHAQVYGADTCDAPALEAIASSLTTPVDVVICNAGVMSARGGIADVGNEASSISDALMTNVAGPFFTTRAFLPALKGAAVPRVAVISSLMGSQQHQGASAYFYRASKAGANNIMVTLANELKGDGITVAAFHPGWVQTDMGGANADITPAQSAAGLVAQCEALTLDKTGGFFNYDGKPLPL